MPHYNLQVSLGDYQLKLETTAKEEIISAGYLAPADASSASENFCKQVVGQKISELLNAPIAHTPFLIPVWFELLRRAQIQSMGEDLIPKKFVDDQICACMGITSAEIQVRIDSGSDNLEKLSQETGVALGCRSCRLDIEGLLSKKKVRRFKNRTAAEWVLRIQELLQNFNQSLGFTVAEFHEGEVLIRVSKMMSQEEMLELNRSVQEYLRSHLDPDLLVFLGGTGQRS